MYTIINIIFLVFKIMQKEIKIEIPEGYEIDEEKSSFSKIVFKKIEKELPQSFEDLERIDGWYVNGVYGIVEKASCLTTKNLSCYGVYPTKKLAEASVALAKLLHIRKAYVGDWEPNWKDTSTKYCIYSQGNTLKIDFTSIHRVLSFPNSQLRDKFFEAPKIRALLEIAKPLL